eukprot:1639845-Pleurochrysis_carterae.AAC.2
MMRTRPAANQQQPQALTLMAVKQNKSDIQERFHCWRYHHVHTNCLTCTHSRVSFDRNPDEEMDQSSS